MNLTVATLADRPDLADALWNMTDSWPKFMTQDPIAALYFDPDIREAFSQFVVAGLDEKGSVVAKGLSMPIYLPNGEPLPTDGWDGAIRRGVKTRLVGHTPNTVCALEIAVTPGMQGSGASSKMLAALRDNSSRLGFEELIVPVRPNGKTDIHEAMHRYAFRTRLDGLPVDPWLRVHVRAGGRIDSIAPRSMVIPGTLDEWRTWTRLPFDRSGPVEIPGALTPVLCDLQHGTAVYVEPNVWVRHRTNPA
ncbi:N-acetyltransferase [Rhodococcus sp. BP22]|uniref:N-acetyltransferase n=1 Tax=Rhodococcus sp. BP22 TaxID=2758566 RepID=UPI0016487A26|nr:N-acetyltransferase [Rhodococcus sp. BP22]